MATREARDARSREGGLRRTLGLPSLVLYGVGLILGAGIYSILGAAASEAGEGLWLAFVLGAGIALLTGLSYAELAAMHPKAGAEYTYAAHAFPRRQWIASGTGYVLIVAGMATAATIAAGFAGYLRVFVDFPFWVGSGAILLAAAGVAILGMRESAWANAAMTTLELGGLGLVVFLAVRHTDITQGFGLSAPSGLVAAGALVFFAYLGFEDLANVAEEAKRPERHVPQAILISVAVTAVVYALVGAAAIALVGADALAGSDSPLATAAGSVGPRYETVLAALALAATANTVLITVVALSRMLLALARGQHAPRVLANLLPNRRTPWLATLAITAGALLFTPLGDVHAIGSVASLATLLAFGIVNVIVIRLRFSEPEANRPFLVPGRIGRMPILPALGLLGSLGFATQLGLDAFLLGGGLTVAGFLAAYVVERQRAAQAS